jgi:hypothetical protein
VNDDADAAVLEVLAEGGTRVIAMRCAGFDRVDVSAAESLGIKVRSPCKTLVSEHMCGFEKEYIGKAFTKLSCCQAKLACVHIWLNVWYA